MHPREGGAPINVPIRVLDSESFEVRFDNVTNPLDFVFEMIDTDNVSGLRQVAIKPIEDTPPDVDVEVEVIRKTNQGYMVTPRVRIPFSGKIRDDHGLGSIEFHYTLASLDSQMAVNSAQVASALQLSPPNAGGVVFAPSYLSFVARQMRLAADDAGKTPQKIPLAAFARRLRELAADDVSREELENRLRGGIQATMLRDHTMDPQDEKEGIFDVEKLGLAVSEIEGQRIFQPRYRMRLWIVATDNNVETGPGIGQSKEKSVVLIVSENDLLLEIAKDEESLHLKLEDAVSRLRDAKLKLEQVAQELPAIQPKEFSPMAVRLDEIQETLVKSWDVSREILTDYQKILKELQINQVRLSIIERVERNICLPLADANNQHFDLTDKSLAAFHKTLEDQKKDMPAGEAANKQLQDLIDRLNRVLDAMGDTTAINKLIEQLTKIEEAERNANQYFNELYGKKKEELLEKEFGPSSKPPEKKENK